MKVRVFFTVLCITMNVIQMSCSSDELTYSCNRDIDNWVKENIVDIRAMDWSEWLELDGKVRIAAYRAFTPSQRVRFWQDKLSDVKRLSWSEEERAHIAHVEDFISSHKEYFSDEPLAEDQIDELELFFYRWMRDGIEKFGWNETVALSIAGTGLRVVNTEGELDLPPTTYASSELSVSPETSCDCKIDWYNMCIDSQCEELQCEVIPMGCGWLLTMPCNGVCN